MSIRKKNSAGASSTLSNFNNYEEEVAAASQSVFSIGYTATAKTLVIINGSTVPKADWTGIGTTDITLGIAINQYDVFQAIG